MFSSDCVGELVYEATTTSIAMAGAFVAFCVEYVSLRLANRHRNVVPGHQLQDGSSKSEEISGQSPRTDKTTLGKDVDSRNEASFALRPNNALSVLTLEAGIMFHSLLIGITLVVAGDSSFMTLFIVITFHQFFEGLALGSRIADLHGLSNIIAISLPLAFALITPIGMGIGIGVLNTFNGNDKTTLIVLGTLDAFSAGILLWVGLVGMWARDWLYGDLNEAELLRASLAILSLCAGCILMGVLGKWA